MTALLGTCFSLIVLLLSIGVIAHVISGNWGRIIGALNLELPNGYVLREQSLQPAPKPSVQIRARPKPKLHFSKKAARNPQRLEFMHPANAAA